MSLDLPTKRRVRAAFIPSGDPRYGCVFSLGSRSVSQDIGVTFSSLLLALAWAVPGLYELGLWVMISLVYSGLVFNMWGYGENLLSLSKKSRYTYLWIKKYSFEGHVLSRTGYCSHPAMQAFILFVKQEEEKCFPCAQKLFSWATTRLDCQARWSLISPIPGRTVLLTALCPCNWKPCKYLWANSLPWNATAVVSKSP